MKRIISFIIAVLLLLSLCACAATEPPKAPESIYLEDYEQLWADLRVNYPFFPVLEAQGIDVNAVYEQYLPYAEGCSDTAQFMENYCPGAEKFFCKGLDKTVFMMYN